MKTPDEEAEVLFERLVDQMAVDSKALLRHPDRVSCRERSTAVNEAALAKDWPAWEDAMIKLASMLMCDVARQRGKVRRRAEQMASEGGRSGRRVAPVLRLVPTK